MPGFADSLDDPGDQRQVYQRHWIGATPMEVELTRDGRAQPGLARADHAAQALTLRESRATATLRASSTRGRPGCDGGARRARAELQSFTLNTSIIAVGEGNYGRLGPDQQQRWTTANAASSSRRRAARGDARDRSPRPTTTANILDRKFTERPMVLQAWGNYGTAWPVVHQQLGRPPGLGRGRLEVVPQVPAGQAPIAGRDIRLGDRGAVDVAARRSGDRYRTTVQVGGRRTGAVDRPHGSRRRRGAARDARRRAGDARDRPTNRGLEVTARARGAGSHTLVVRTG